MGYYTDFELSVKAADQGDVEEFVFTKLSELLQSSTGYEFEREDDLLVLFEVKWYGSHADMINVSRQFPDFIFTLDGKGEDGDVWRVYYYAGKSQQGNARVVYDDFDVSKLA